MSLKPNKLAVLGLGLGLLASPLIDAQDIGKYNDRSSKNYYAYSQDTQNYNIINKVMNDGERLRDIQPLMRSDYLPKYGYKLEKILNETEPLSSGDKITVVESQTPDGIYYPYYLDLDYLNPKKKDLEIIASMVPPKEDKPFRFTLNYYDFKGRKYMTLWNNKKDPGFFEVEGPYTNLAKFILPGSMDDYRITSPFGYRKDPLREDTGGLATEFHPAIDLAMKDHSNMYGRKVLAPMNGLVRFGYIQKKNTDDKTVEDEKSAGRYVEFRSNDRVPVLFPDGNTRREIVGCLFYHTRAASDEMVEKAMPKHATEWWWLRTLSRKLDSKFSQKDLIENIRDNYEEGRLSKLGISTNWIPVKQGDTIGRVGNTGRESGVHLHYGVLLNGRWIDPIVFQKYNLASQNFSLKEMEDKKQLIENILKK